MEITLKRWLGTAAVGCLVVVVGVSLRPDWLGQSAGTPAA